MSLIKNTFILVFIIVLGQFVPLEKAVFAEENTYLDEAKIQYGEGNYKKVIETLAAALKNDPNSEEAYFNIALAYTQLDRPKLAIKAYEKALHLNPKSEETRLSMATLYLDLEQYSKAITQLKYLLKTNKDNPVIAEKLGILYYNQKKYPEAIDYFKKAIEISPERAVAVHNYLGMAYFSLGQKAEARKSLEKAQKAYVLTAEGRRLMALLYLEDENYNGAINVLSRLIRDDEAKLDDYNNLGTAYSRKGDHEKAKVAFEKVLEEEPNHKVALQNLGLAHSQLEEHEEAKRVFRKLVAISPRNAIAFYSLGHAQEQLFEYGPALTAYLKAKDLGYADMEKLDRAISYLRSREEQPATTP